MSQNVNKKQQKRKYNLELKPLSSAEKKATDSVLDRLLGKELEDDQLDLNIALDQPDQPLDHVEINLKRDDQPITPLPENPVIKSPCDSNPVIESPGDNNTPLLNHPVIKSPGHVVTPLPSNREKGFFTSNWIEDELMPTLEISEQVVLRRIIRLTFGFNRSISDSVGSLKLAEKCNMSESGIKKTIRSLEQKAMIKVHRDMSGNRYTGGNKYEILFLKEEKTPGHQITPLPSNPIKDHDHDFKITDHHQKEVMTIYKNLTGNDSWTKSDAAAYEKLKHLSLQEISQLIKSTLEKAHQKPASLAYFVKAYQNPTVINPAQKSVIKAKLAAIVERKRQAHVGTRYTIADLTFDVKAECIREGIAFDNDLFNELLEKKD